MNVKCTGCDKQHPKAEFCGTCGCKLSPVVWWKTWQCAFACMMVCILSGISLSGLAIHGSSLAMVGVVGCVIGFFMNLVLVVSHCKYEDEDEDMEKYHDDM